MDGCPQIYKELPIEMKRRKKFNMFKKFGKARLKLQKWIKQPIGCVGYVALDIDQNMNHHQNHVNLFVNSQNEVDNDQKMWNKNMSTDINRSINNM